MINREYHRKNSEIESVRNIDMSECISHRSNQTPTPTPSLRGSTSPPSRVESPSLHPSTNTPPPTMLPATSTTEGKIIIASPICKYTCSNSQLPSHISMEIVLVSIWRQDAETNLPEVERISCLVANDNLVQLHCTISKHGITACKGASFEQFVASFLETLLSKTSMPLWADHTAGQSDPPILSMSSYNMSSARLMQLKRWWTLTTLQPTYLRWNIRKSSPGCSNLRA